MLWFDFKGKHSIFHKCFANAASLFSPNSSFKRYYSLQFDLIDMQIQRKSVFHFNERKWHQDQYFETIAKGSDLLHFHLNEGSCDAWILRAASSIYIVH